MSDPFDPDALFVKSKLFINRALDARDRAEFDAAALWASLALEILAKWALASVNPCLVADPSDDGKSLLTAAGLSKNVAEFRTLPAKGAYSRCGRAFPGFNVREAERISGNRNDDVHSGSLPFAQLDEDRWWEGFWPLIAVLLEAHGHSIYDLVDAKQAPIAENYIRRHAETVAQLTMSRIARAAANWASRGNKKRLGGFIVGSEFEGSTTCPACGNEGTLHGDSVESEDIQYPDDPEDYRPPMAILVVSVDTYMCTHCGLDLYGIDYVSAAGLPEKFETEIEYQGQWEEYNNE